MKVKGIIIFGIAVLALILSVINFYFQFFYKSDELKALVIEMNAGRDGNYGAEMAFINQGNQASTISEIQLVFLHPLKDSLALVPWIEREKASEPKAIVVRPGEVLTTRVVWDCSRRQFLSSHINYLWSKGDEVWFKVKIRFYVTDSFGEKHVVDYDPCKIFVVEDKMGTAVCRPVALNLLVSPISKWHIPYVEGFFQRVSRHLR